MPDMTPEPQHARPEKRSRGWRALRGLAITVGIALSPLFFLDMFRNVRDLLHASMGATSWITPAATEGSFLFLFLLDILLLLARKPQAWLRYAPYLFAVMSLALNIWGGHGNPLPMLGYAAVTLAFFAPVVAGEQAIRSMSVSDSEVRQAQEMKAAMRHAADLMRSRTGWRRWRAPSLLRIQIRHCRPPAAVVEAVAEGAAGKGAARWEEPVEEWVMKALTRNVRLAARMAAEERAIAASLSPPADTELSRTSRPRKPRQRPGQKRRASRGTTQADKRAIVLSALADNPERPLADIAAEAGVSVKTVSRYKNGPALEVVGRERMTR
jgi:Bacterial regulatory proteins, lacI family